MSLKLPTSVGHQTVLKEGTKLQHGLDESVYRNIAAVLELANITRSSFGPNGLNKLIVNNLEKLFMTADAGVVLKELDVQHPAARIVIEASRQQDAEMGDGCNLVVILTAALLEKAQELLRMGLKASVVAHGFRIARQQALDILDGECAKAVPSATLADIVRTVLTAKQCGLQDLLSGLVMEAVRLVGEDRHLADDAVERLQLVNPDNIRCVKVLGGTLSDSACVGGVVLNKLPESVCQSVAGPCRIAVYSCPVDISGTETKGTVLFNNAADMLSYSHGEETLIKEKIEQLHQSGVKVIVTNEKFGDLALHYINRHDMVAIRVPSKFDIQRICKACQAPSLVKFETRLDHGQYGECGSVCLVEFGADKCCVINSAGNQQGIASIVLRGASLNVLDDVERAIEDAVNVVRVIGRRDERVVAGAGAAEAHLSRRLHLFAMSTGGVIQYPLKAAAEAFEAVPGCLAANSGYDRTDAVARLIAANQSNPLIGIASDGTARDPLADTTTTHCVDSLTVKKRAVSLAFSAADTILSTDHIIMSKPAGGPKPRASQPADL